MGIHAYLADISDAIEFFGLALSARDLMFFAARLAARDILDHACRCHVTGEE